MLDDILYFVVGMAIVAIIIALFAFSLGTFTDIVTNESIDMPSGYQFEDRLQATSDNMAGDLDKVFLGVYIGMIILLLVIAWALPSNPLFFVSMCWAIFIVAMFAGYIANTFYVFYTEEGLLAPIFAEQPITAYIMTHYMLFSVIPVFLIVIVFFIKPPEDSTI